MPDRVTLRSVCIVLLAGLLPAQLLATTVVVNDSNGESISSRHGDTHGYRLPTMSMHPITVTRGPECPTVSCHRKQDSRA